MDSSVRNRKPARPARSQPRTHGTKTPKPYRPSDSLPFPQVRGKTLADVYVTRDDDMSCVILCFADNTELVVDIEPSLSFAADYSDWKTGEERIIKRWRRGRST
jgi:hypothetical protein